MSAGQSLAADIALLRQREEAQLIDRVAEIICDGTEVATSFAALPEGPQSAPDGIPTNKADFRAIARSVIEVIRNG